jgi:3-hydroxybutyryl-CoA dehydrogenase
MQERLGVAGSGAIACGLAATAARYGDVMLWARSPASADRARVSVEKICGRFTGEVNAAKIRVVTDLDAFADTTAAIEAVVEDQASKTALLTALAGVTNPETLLGTTTSSLSIEQLAGATGASERFVGLHVFNPVPKMKLVELAFPSAASEATRRRAWKLCEDLGKTPVEVPDSAGFVVNRLLFPFLFDAVRFLEESGMEPAAVDSCMTLGAGHPMGPLALLDFVGLDVAEAIGESIGADVPARVRGLVADGALGKKSGRGFYDYSGG